MIEKLHFCEICRHIVTFWPIVLKMRLLWGDGKVAE